MSMIERLRELSEKWTRQILFGVGKSDRLTDGQRRTMRDCANELDAILAESQAGEAVAWCGRQKNGLSVGPLAWTREEILASPTFDSEIDVPVPLGFIATPPAPSAADAGLTEEQKAAQDLRLYGTSFMRDGKRIDPRDVWIATDPKAGAWPHAMPVPDKRATEAECTEAAAQQFFAEGWNAYRAALTTAAPQAPVGGEPNIGVGVDVTAEGAHVTVAHRIGAVDRIIYSEFHAAPPVLTQPVDWVPVSDSVPPRAGWYLGCNYGNVEPLRFDGSNWQHTRITRDLAMPSHWADFATIAKPAPSSGEGAK